ncbi:MAG: hypothetical protein HYW15_02050 [Candidatus Giovannonibacteria bacterium]|nr:MAG: hypothetical protein HYW15_02050 [Candidatus Giovannonibacteria bacterium]
MARIIISATIVWLVVGIASLYFLDAKEESDKEDRAFLDLWRKRGKNSQASWSDKGMIWVLNLYELFGVLVGPLVLLKTCRFILRSFAVNLVSSRPFRATFLGLGLLLLG